MAERVERGEFPGIVTVVARGDDVRVDTIGVTHFGGDVPMRRDTPFRIASMTKPILAAATMSLVEDDLLDIEEPVQRLLPELADRRVLRSYDAELDDTVPAHRPITVDDLLTFRLGFGLITEPEFDPPVPINERRRRAGPGARPAACRGPRTTPDEWIRRFGTLPLIYQPGERWNYNVGSLVLGVLLARAAGQPLGDVLRERIFEPLRMADTGFWLPAERAARLPGAVPDRRRDQAADRASGQRPGELGPPAGLPVRLRRPGVHGGRLPDASPGCCWTRACTAAPGCCRSGRSRR